MPVTNSASVDRDTACSWHIPGKLIINDCCKDKLMTIILALTGINLTGKCAAADVRYNFIIIVI